jgi:hypothetical protein
MIRTIVSLDESEKVWLSHVAKNKKVSMAEVIREAIHYYHSRHKNIANSDFDILLKKTKGIWPKKTDGLKYQQKIRDEWN